MTNRAQVISEVDYLICNVLKDGWRAAAQGTCRSVPWPNRRLSFGEKLNIVRIGTGVVVSHFGSPGGLDA